MSDFAKRRSTRLSLLSVCLSVGVCVVGGSIAATRPAAAAAAAPIENSVVKVFATMRYPDPFKPWTKQAPSEVTASGVVIEGKRILTNAHVVLYASQVQIQANAAGDKVSASVVAVAPGIDLAVLQLDDASFFDTHPPVARASQLPRIKDAVLAYGFPTGGNSLSITKGIVSRIEFVSYNYPVSGLRIQIDAAINPGNSGGPAIAGDKMIGLAFSKFGGDTQNIGYIIPNEEVELFLKDIADGHYDGKPAMYDELQTLENPALRDYLKLDKSVEGMVVHRPDKTEASYPLKEWDVITRIGDTPIDNQGMVKIDQDLRVSFAFLIQRLAKDGLLPLTVVRAGKTVRLQLPVSAEHPTLVRDLRGSYPPYFIYGPLVFSIATWQMVSSIEGNAGMLRLLGFRQEPADHPRPRCTGCRARGTRRGLLAVLSAQARERLFEPGRLGRVCDQRHAHPQPAPPGRLLARPQGSLRHHRIRSERRRGAGLLAAGDHGRHRRNPDRQRRARPRLPGHARGVAGEERAVTLPRISSGKSP